MVPKNVDTLKTYGFIAVIAGFILFVIADSGIISWISKKTIETSVTETDSSHLNQDIQRLKKDFDQLKLTAQVRREKIQDLIGQLHAIDKEIEIEEKAIKSLASAKTKLRESKSRFSHSISKSRALSSVNQASALPQWKFESWSDVVSKVQQITDQTAGIETHDQTIVFFQSGIFSETTPYMKPQGLRVAKALAIGARDLGVDSIAVTYTKDDNDGQARAKVATKYFKSLLGDEIPVVTNANENSKIRSPEKVEFWVNLKTGERL